MKSINPATEALIRQYAADDPAALDEKLKKAETAFAPWRTRSFEERANLMRRVAQVLRQRAPEYARLMTDEMGKTIVAAEGEVEKCAWVCDFFAEKAQSFLAPEPVSTDGSESFVRYDPLGPVLAIMPWNFPLWQVFRFAAPSLMAGNVGLLKHASNVCGTALAIEAAFREAGFPEGVMTTLLVPSENIAGLIARPEVRAVTLTGSERAGMEVAAEAGKNLKKTVLELGGSDPFIVLADADLPVAAKQAAKARMINSGQSCIAAKRFIVEEAIADRFEPLLVAEMKQLRVGDPTDRNTDVGPLAREDLLETLHEQVQRSLTGVAELLLGGQRLAMKGFYYAPTVLRVTPEMPAFVEETFGPVAALTRARDAEHALRLANESRYGLGASLWTADKKRAAKLAAEIESGSVFINGIVKSDPRLPFGGIKQSGYGRELSEVGIREFVNIKSVWIG